MEQFPEVLNPELVGSYPPVAKSGGGYVWDEVLEYRVWCHPEHGAEDIEDGNDYYFAFASFAEAKNFSDTHEGTEEPIALVLQREHINEPVPGKYVHVKEERITEWLVDWLRRPRRDERTIPDFFSKGPSSNRLDVLRGTSEK